MKKRVMIIISLCVVGAGIIGGALYWKNQSQQKLSTTSNIPSSPSVLTQEMLTWEDPAGFSFQYPKGTITIDKHDEDTVNYAHLEFKDSTASGQLFVWAKDTDATDVGTWMTLDKTLAKATALDTTLGGLPAKKIMLSEPTKKLIVGAVTDQIIFTVELEAVGDTVWQPLFDEIVKTFKFTDAANEDVSNNGDAPTEEFQSAVDEEETIE